MSTFAVTAVVLFAIPLALGLIAYIVPLQIGARGCRLPAAQPALLLALSYPAAFTIFGSFLYRPSEAGFAALPAALGAPLLQHPRRRRLDRRHRPRLLGFVCFAVNLVVTLRNMRAPGMAWRRVPLFTWGAGPLRLPGDRHAAR